MKDHSCFFSPNLSSTLEGGKRLKVDLRWGSAMNQCEDREEGALPLRPLCGDNMRARPKLRGDQTLLIPAVCP
ncbi:hypothetical protein INR49_002783 [Caranx melampygus]|nr:hypothetical protein INR49_002783 [Caranx melampygus]